MNARDPWVAWLSRQAWSGWESFRVPLAGRPRLLRDASPAAASSTFQTSWVAAASARPPAPYLEPARGGPRRGWHVDRLVEDAAGRWRTSGKLDAADFGNTTLYGAIGAYGVEDLPDLTRVIKICGPRKRDIPLSPPHYDLPGGHVYRAIDATRVLLLGCRWRADGRVQGGLLREFPKQRQRRVVGAAVVATTVGRDGLCLTAIDFAPRGPDLAFACRVVVVENTGRSTLEGLTLHQILVNSRRSWDAPPSHRGVIVDDREDGTGLRLFSPAADPSAAAASHGVHLLDGRPEQAWQAVDLPLAFPAIGPGGAASAWSALVPRIAGGDPHTDAAEAALEGFDPAAALAATTKAWTGWSGEVAFRGGRPMLAGLVDNLQVLLKTHEGERGFHLGTTYQRHTHCWTRDNYLMQRGLLAGGRTAEAARNFEGFRACRAAGGIACGYHVFSRTNWIPRPTPELCAYLVLMARDLELWSGEAPSGETWDLVVDCADTLALNSRGLVGFDGDEIWFWEMDPALFAALDGRDLRDPASLAEFCVLDTCWLALAALAYAARLARARGEAGKAAAWDAKRARIEEGLDRHLWDPARGLYTAFLFPDGRRYPGPLVNGYATPSFFGAPETRPGVHRAMALECLRTLATPEGVAKGNADTPVYAGMTPAYLLHALGSIGEHRAGDRYLRDLVRSLPSSGGAWEYSAIDLPWTGTDKRRGGDSGVVLAAVMDYLVGLRPTWSGFTIRPHLPAYCRAIEVAGLRVQGHRLDVRVGRSRSRVLLDGRPLATIPAGRSFTWTED